VSTRSCIAQWLPGSHRWRGVYHHWDGYPSGLGCYIFRAIRYRFKDVQSFLDYALAHDGGWSHIYPAAVVTASPKGGETFGRARRPQCYCHGYFATRDEIRPGHGMGIIEGCECREKPYIPGQGDPPSCDPLSIEWVYVLDPETRTMTILEAYGEDIPGTVAWWTLRPDGTREAQPQRAYRHRLRDVVALDGPEPDWWRMEGMDGEERKTWVDRYFPPAT